MYYSVFSRICRVQGHNPTMMHLLPCVAFLLIASSLATDDAGLKYLEENKSKEGVIVLESGLQYKVLQAGDGDFHPAVDTPCLCHYQGTLIDGTQFDSSYDRGSPTTFAPNQVIKGWTEIMQLMTAGDKFEITIPSELGYGERGSPPNIPGGSVLVFIMEIIELQGDESSWVPAAKCDPSTGTKCNEKELKYIEKTKSWDESKIRSELERLGKIGGTNTKPELVHWIQRRRKILEKLSAKEEL